MKGKGEGIRSHCHGLRWCMLAGVLGMVVFAGISPAAAFDLEAPIADPLSTMPEAIKTGVTLPGDAAPVPCPARTGFTTPLSLGEAVDVALCNNPQIRSAWTEIKIQAGAVGEARAAYLPTVSGTGSMLNDHTTYPGSKIPSSTYTSPTIYAALNWRLFDFGGRSASLQSANLLLAAALDSHQAALEDTMSKAIQAFFDGLTAKAAWHAKEQDEAIARSTLEAAKVREERGAGARSDTLQATTALAKASLEKNRAQSAYEKAVAVLIYVLGVPTKTHIILADDLEGGDGAVAKDLDVWLADTQKNHPAIVAAREQWEAAQRKIVSTRSDGLPTIDFSANYYQNGYPGQGLAATHSQVTTVGVALSVPIFEGFTRTYKIRGAEAQAEEKEAELADKEHSILTEVVKAYSDATSSAQNLQASEYLLKAAQDSLAVSQRRYERGAADILEVLNTQTALADAQQERIRCLSEWREARLRLMANAGVLGRTAVNLAGVPQE